MDAGKLKVIVVYGSESGTTKRGIDRWVKKWEKRDGRNFEIGEVVTGNALVKRLRTGDGNAQATNLEFLSQQYDVVLVAVRAAAPNAGRWLELPCCRCWVAAAAH